MTSTAVYAPVSHEHFSTVVNSNQGPMGGETTTGVYPTTDYAITTDEGGVTVLRPTVSHERRRPISSTILSEEIIGDLPPEHTVRYVEVPIVEEVCKSVPVKSVVEVEKVVPRYEVEYVEKVVEVPQIHYIERQVEKKQIEEVIREVPIGTKNMMDRTRTVIRAVPRIEYVNVEKTVEVPGEVIDISRSPDFQPPPKQVKRHNDAAVPIVVAQTIRPVITESNEVIDVDVYEYEPNITPVDVYVATPIASKLTTIGAVQDVHQYVSIPTAQYNTILKSLNSHLDERVAELPYVQENGVVEFLSQTEAPGYVPLPSIDAAKVKSAGAQVAYRRSQANASRRNPNETGALRTESRASLARGRQTTTDQQQRLTSHANKVTQRISYNQQMEVNQAECYTQGHYQGSVVTANQHQNSDADGVSSAETPVSKVKQVPGPIKKKKPCEC